MHLSMHFVVRVYKIIKLVTSNVSGCDVVYCEIVFAVETTIHYMLVEI